jgi:hypothetical protein
MSFLDDMFGDKKKGASRSNRNKMVAMNEKDLGKKIAKRAKSAIQKRRERERELLKDL